MTTTDFLNRFTTIDPDCRATFHDLIVQCAAILGRRDGVMAERFGVATTTLARWRAGATWPGRLIRELTHAKIISDVQALARMNRKMRF